MNKLLEIVFDCAFLFMIFYFGYLFLKHFT